MDNYCKLCDKIFIKKKHDIKSGILKHLRTEHKDVDSLEYFIKYEGFIIPKCRVCGKEAERANSYFKKLRFQKTCSDKECKIKIRKHSDETRRRLSEKRKKFLLENPTQSPYWNYRLKRSNPERVLEEEFKRKNISGWVPNLSQGIYFYDFAFPELKIDLEIDGSTHNSFEQKEKDRIRDEWTVSRGWRVLRIKASVIRYNVNLAIEEILKFIGPENLETQKNFDIDEFLKKRKEERLLEKANLKKTIKNMGITLRKKRISRIRRLRGFIKTERIKDRLFESEIDFTSFGWAIEASKIIGIKPQKVSRWMERNMTEFYNNYCYKRKVHMMER